MSSSQKAQWIWGEFFDGPEENVYLDFRKEFEWSSSSSAVTLRIAAFHDFLVCLDGVEVGRRQFCDYPDAVTATTFALPDGLAEGHHVLAVLAWYAGRDFSTCRIGTPGLWCELRGDEKLVVATGADWRCRLDPAWTSGPIAVVNPQLGFTTSCDLRLDDGWLHAGYDDENWSAPILSLERGIPEERPLPPLPLEEMVPPEILGCGYLTRHQMGKGTPAARAIASDSIRAVPPGPFFGGPGEYLKDPLLLDRPRTVPMPSDIENGAYLILDCGGEKEGQLELELEAAEGTVVDIAHGEHLIDGRVRCSIGGRCFADRLICRDGLNLHTLPFRRLGGRYLELHLTEMTRPVVLRKAGIRPVVLPLPPAAPWEDGDGLAARLRALSVNTLHLCMHEHFEDTPWREQALYSYDSRNQALFGYYVWGNYDFAAVSFDLLGRGLRPDGLLELCAPARVPVTIPIYSFVWITEVCEQYLFSGDARLFQSFDAQIEDMLERAWKRRNAVTGLPRPPEGTSIWNFFEWRDNQDGQENRPADYSLYSIYLSMALLAWEKTRARLGRPVAIRSKELMEQVKEKFRREDGFIGTVLEGGELSGFHEHVNALALKLGILPSSLYSDYVRHVAAKDMVLVSTSILSHALDALALAGEAGRWQAEQRLHEEFNCMLFSGYDTLWETKRGAYDFNGAGSLCHGWSGVGVYWQGAWRLGVRPLDPGFKRFEVRPWLCAQDHLTGEVPTPSGPIRIRCRRQDGGMELEVRYPRNLEPVVAPWPEMPLVRDPVLIAE